MNYEVPLVISLEKIWDRSRHAALTDLIKWKGEFFCIFRESDTHYGGVNGVLRFLHSPNGIVWNLLTLIEKEGWDLRDPKLSITPDGRLMLLVGASRYNRNKLRLSSESLVSFSTDALNWSEFKTVFKEEWLWRLTWFQGKGYGFTYFFTNPLDSSSEWRVRLYETMDGIIYKPLSSFNIPGKPNEVTLRIFPYGQMIALIRRDGKHDHNAWIGSSIPPYEDWLFTETSCYLGGPNFIILPDEKMWAAGRLLSETPYGIIEKMAILGMNKNDLQPIIILPSLGDCSYPGLVFEDPYLWVSYYSSHEGHAAIYLAKLSMPHLNHAFA